MPPVVPSKITVPELPHRFLPRPALLAALDGGDHAAVTLICAPAGFGKTSLLAHWARDAGSKAGVAWVDLDRRDDDPRLLWTAVLAALAARPSVPSDSPVHNLRAEVSAAPAYLSHLVAALDTLPVRVALVLHDVHKLTGAAALQGLAALVAARPAGVRALLCSRVDPPLSLAALRAEGSLHEIRRDRLPFSAAETTALLHRWGLRLTPAQTRDLHVHTGGWPAGLRFAAVVLRRGVDPDDFLARFSRNDNPVADFLVGEVLAALRDAERDLLAVVDVDNLLPVTPDIAGSGRPAVVRGRFARETGLVTRVRGSHNRYLVDSLLAAHVRAMQRRGPPVAGPRIGAARSWAGRDERGPTCLTPQERAVLEWLPSSLSVADIAEELGIPHMEAHARIRAVYTRLGASSRRTAVAAAYQRGLLR